MKPLNAYLDTAKAKLTKVGAVVIAGGTALMAAVPVRADIVADVQGAITSATSQTSTVGGYVAVAVATLVVVGLVIAMLRKM